MNEKTQEAIIEEIKKAYAETHPNESQPVWDDLDTWYDSFDDADEITSELNWENNKTVLDANVEIEYALMAEGWFEDPEDEDDEGTILFAHVYCNYNNEINVIGFQAD